jgi:hypothetical protein
MMILLEIGFYAGLTALVLLALYARDLIARPAWGSRWFGLPSIIVFLLSVAAIFWAFFLHADLFRETVLTIDNEWIRFVYTFGPILWALVIALCHDELLGRGQPRR